MQTLNTHLAAARDRELRSTAAAPLPRLSDERASLRDAGRVVLRRARPQDGAAVAHLAALDEAPIPRGDVLVVELDERIVAAVPVRAATPTGLTGTAATRTPARAQRTTPTVAAAATAVARPVAPARSTTSRVVAAAALLVGVAGSPSTYVPSRPLPARSGAGRRIVYAETAAHLWVVGDDGAVLRDYAVTGRVGRPKPSVYHVYSKSTVATNPGEKLRFEYMVRFAVGLTGARIGFHTIPRYVGGAPIQSESQLGRAIGSGGCVRQSRADAVWLYGWSRVGDEVVVLR